MKDNEKQEAIKTLQSDELEARLAQSESSLKLMRDYISALQLNYRKKFDKDSLTNLIGLLFYDNTLDHFDELLESASKTIDDTLLAIVDSKDN